MGRFIPTVTIILRWILCSCHTNSTVAVWPPLFLQKCCGGHIGPPYCESVFFPVAQVVMELLSGIKVFLISMVALKILMPQKKNRSKKGNGYRFILSVTIILRWILHSCHRNSAVAVRPSWLLQIFWGGHVGPPYWESLFFLRLQRWP